MLKKISRFQRKELDLFFKKKTCFKKGILLFLRYQKKQKPNQRFAFVVSGSKSAVIRNLVRRRAFEIIRTELHRFPKNQDMVFFFKFMQTKKAPKAEELKKDIINVVSSINI